MPGAHALSPAGGRWLRFVASAVLALVLATSSACGTSGTDTAARKDPTTSTPTTGSPDVSDDTGASAPSMLTASGEGDLAGVTLTGELAVGPGGLQVVYRLDNQSGGPIVVGDAVPVAAGSSFSPDPAGAWITASTQGFVTVGRWPIRQPDEVVGDRAPPQSLYLVRVEGGTAIERTFELRWPLQGRHPYFGPDDLPVPLPDPVASVRLCLGVQPVTAAVEAAPMLDEGDATWLAVPMDDLSGTLCTEPVPLA